MKFQPPAQAIAGLGKTGFSAAAPPISLVPLGVIAAGSHQVKAGSFTRTVRWYLKQSLPAGIKMDRVDK